MNSANSKIAIIGAGISGLATAYLLKKRGFEVAVFEKSERVGGNIRSERVNGFLIEHGPNSTLETSPLLNDLFELLGIANHKIYAEPAAAKRYILKKGKLRLMPMNPLAFMGSDLFSIRAKLGLLREPFIKSKSNPYETLAEFTLRRLGQEFLEYAIDPFVSGVFAGDPYNLNVKTAFPKLYELEQDYGSLIKGAIGGAKARRKNKEKSKQSAKTFSFINGMQELVDALYRNLKDDINTGTEVTSISLIPDANHQLSTINYQLQTDKVQSETYDFVVLSLPAYAAADLLRNIDEGLSDELTKVYYPPVTVVTAAIHRDAFGFNPEGFGFLVPGRESRKILGSLWNSSIFPNRAPKGYSLLTTFVGGSKNPELASLSDSDLVRVVESDLKSIMGYKGKAEFIRIIRWKKAIPQYTRNYTELYSKIEQFHSKNPGLFLCSNYYGGISVCDCIKSAYSVADKISTHSSLPRGESKGVVYA